MLARILAELKILKTPVGLLAISAAAVDDAVAWCLLALVISLVNASSGLNALWIFIVGVAYVVFVVVVVSRGYRWLLTKERRLEEAGPSQFIVAVTFVMVFMSAWFTSALGIHAIFGGFVIGVIVPHENGFAVKLAEKFEEYVTILFLPLYFALSGLKTEIGLLNDWKSWGLVLLVILAAIIGKVAGVTLTARAFGVQWRESITIGYLMTCKGLVEIIVLNIGLESGVIDKKIFAILLLMAIVTTMLTAPMVIWLYPKDKQRKLAGYSQATTIATISTHAPDNAPIEQKVLISIDQLAQIPAAMQLMGMITITPKAHVEIHAVHFLELTPRLSSVLRYWDADQWIHSDPVARVMQTFASFYQLNMYTTLTVCKSEEFAAAVATQVDEDNSNIALIPWRWNDENGEDGPAIVKYLEQNTRSHQSDFIRRVFSKVPSNVAVVLDRGLGQKSSKVLVKMEGHLLNVPSKQTDREPSVYCVYSGGEDDNAVLELARNMQSNNVRVTVIKVDAPNDHLLTGFKYVIPAEGADGMSMLCADLLPFDLLVVGRGGKSSLLGTTAMNLLFAGCKASLMIVRGTSTLSSNASAIQ